jgi:hypothetical protein
MGIRRNGVSRLHTRQFVLGVTTEEVGADAGFLTETLDTALGGARVRTSRVEHTQ